jgi:hypothetical protein
VRALERFARSELSKPVVSEVAEVARQLAGALGGDAVLFYGSTLRMTNPDGVLDFYILQDREQGGLLREMFWPRVSYHELSVAGRILPAKVATLSLATFEAAATGSLLDTTIWTRFSQPARLVFSRSPVITERVIGAVCDCLRAASRFAAVLGPTSGVPKDYWLALFQQTYRAEFRVEKMERADVILLGNPDYYRDALQLAWHDMDLVARPGDEVLQPIMHERQRAAWRARWRRRRIAGKPLNLLRLVRAAWTFDGAARYAAWKIERHSGIAIMLTPWRERHPVLAAPGALLELWRAGRKGR